MPFDIPKAGSVSALRQAFNNRETQAQTEAQKPATFRSRPVTPRSPAQTRIAAPPRQTPSPPPSRLAEATYGQKTVIASPRPATPATTSGQSIVPVVSDPQTTASPITQQAVLIAPRPVSAPTSTPSTPPPLTPSDVTVQGFGRRETTNFEWPAGPRTDYAYEHHGHHKGSPHDTSFPTPLPANPTSELHHINDTTALPANEKPLSRLKKLSEADSNSPLAKFRRADTRNIKTASTPSTVAPLTPDNAVAVFTTPLSGPLSIPVPQRQVHDRIAVIEAVAHESVLGTPGPSHQPITPFFSPSDQASQMPGAFKDSDASYFPRQLAAPTQSTVTAQNVPNIVTAVVVAIPSRSGASPTETTIPLLLQSVAVPYFECPSPVVEHMHDKAEDELVRVGQVLDKIVVEHRAALEDVIARLGKELRGMKNQYDEADIPERIKKEIEPFAVMPEVNKIPEDEIKVERHDSVHDHPFPEPHRSIATLAPKINEQTGILLALIRQIKEVATVWSVDLEQIQAVTDYPTMHRAARTLTRYANDSPRPLNWCGKNKVRFQDEGDALEGWEEGCGMQWGFDGHGGWAGGVTDTRLFDISKKVLWLLDQCDQLLVNVEVDNSEASLLVQKEQRLQEEQCCTADGVEEDDVLDVIELYTLH